MFWNDLKWIRVREHVLTAQHLPCWSRDLSNHAAYIRRNSPCFFMNMIFIHLFWPCQIKGHHVRMNCVSFTFVSKRHTLRLGFMCQIHCCSNVPFSYVFLWIVSSLTTLWPPIFATNFNISIGFSCESFGHAGRITQFHHRTNPPGWIGLAYVPATLEHLFRHFGISASKPKTFGVKKGDFPLSHSNNAAVSRCLMESWKARSK